MAAALFEDSNYQDYVLSLIVRDHAFLRQYSHMLKADDFRPATGKKLEPWVLATLALDHYERYRAPAGKLITSLVRDHAKATGLGAESKQKLLDIAASTLRRRVGSVTAIADRLTEYKRQVTKKVAIDKLIELQANGELTDDEFRRIATEALDLDLEKRTPQDYFQQYEDRIKRRLFYDDHRYPLLLVDPLDVQIRAIARGHVGLIVAPLKRGKSLALGHIACSYAFQGFNVLMFTLEDPLADLEDRLDAMITAIPIKYLHTRSKQLRARFQRSMHRYRGRIYTFDGTDGQVSMGVVEQEFQAMRDAGRPPDVVIVDYDDEIKPAKKHAERRFEFADIYRDIRQFAARNNIFFWTAAQSNKMSSDKKIIGEKDIAEDISKIRKCTLALSLGLGEWGEDSYNLFVMAHRNDRKHFAVPIMSNKSKMLFFDREATLYQMRQVAMGEGAEPEEGTAS